MKVKELFSELNREFTFGKGKYRGKFIHGRTSSNNFTNRLLFLLSNCPGKDGNHDRIINDNDDVVYQKDINNKFPFAYAYFIGEDIRKLKKRLNENY